jgi:hypothetical protein
MPYRLQKFVLFSFLTLLAACNSHQTQEQQGDKETVSQNVTAGPADTTHLKYNHLISNIPVPFEILNKLAGLHLAYTPGLINPLNAMSTYNKRESKSLNLGVYGADLTYIISLGEFKEFAQHIKTIKHLADELDIPLAFDDEMMSRYNSNPPNADTLQNALFNSYHEIDRSLKANDRIGMAALVVCGGWVESLYLTTRTIGDNDNSGKYMELYQLVLAQKKHLQNLISLLGDFKTEPFLHVVAGLKKTETLYAAAVESNSLKKEELKKISEELAKLRAFIISEN